MGNLTCLPWCFRTKGRGACVLNLICPSRPPLIQTDWRLLKEHSLWVSCRIKVCKKKRFALINSLTSCRLCQTAVQIMDALWILAALVAERDSHSFQMVQSFAHTLVGQLKCLRPLLLVQNILGLAEFPTSLQVTLYHLLFESDQVKLIL